MTGAYVDVDNSLLSDKEEPDDNSGPIGPTETIPSVQIENSISVVLVNDQENPLLCGWTKQTRPRRRFGNLRDRRTYNTFVLPENAKYTKWCEYLEWKRGIVETKKFRVGASLQKKIWPSKKQAELVTIDYISFLKSHVCTELSDLEETLLGLEIDGARVSEARVANSADAILTITWNGIEEEENEERESEDGDTRTQKRLCTELNIQREVKNSGVEEGMNLESNEDESCSERRYEHSMLTDPSDPYIILQCARDRGVFQALSRSLLETYDSGWSVCLKYAPSGRFDCGCPYWRVEADASTMKVIVDAISCGVVQFPTGCDNIKEAVLRDLDAACFEREGLTFTMPRRQSEDSHVRRLSLGCSLPSLTFSTACDSKLQNTCTYIAKSILGWPMLYDVIGAAAIGGAASREILAGPDCVWICFRPKPTRIHSLQQKGHHFIADERLRSIFKEDAYLVERRAFLHGLTALMCILFDSIERNAPGSPKIEHNINIRFGRISTEQVLKLLSDKATLAYCKRLVSIDEECSPYGYFWATRHDYTRGALSTCWEGVYTRVVGFAVKCIVSAIQQLPPNSNQSCWSLSYYMLIITSIRNAPSPFHMLAQTSYERADPSLNLTSAIRKALEQSFEENGARVVKWMNLEVNQLGLATPRPNPRPLIFPPSWGSFADRQDGVVMDCITKDYPSFKAHPPELPGVMLQLKRESK